MTNPAQIKQIKVDLKRTIRILEKGWTQGSLAKDKSGACVSVNSKSAARFCLIGALGISDKELIKLRYLGSNITDPKYDAYNYLTSRLGNLTIFNDEAKSKKVVMAALHSAVNDLKVKPW